MRRTSWSMLARLAMEGALTRPSTQSLWKGQTPSNVSPSALESTTKKQVTQRTMPGRRQDTRLK
jgi:hypothetical protein